MQRLISFGNRLKSRAELENPLVLKILAKEKSLAKYFTSRNIIQSTVYICTAIAFGYLHTYLLSITQSNTQEIIFVTLTQIRQVFISYTICQLR